MLKNYICDLPYSPMSCSVLMLWVLFVHYKLTENCSSAIFMGKSFLSSAKDRSAILRQQQCNFTGKMLLVQGHLGPGRTGAPFGIPLEVGTGPPPTGAPFCALDVQEAPSLRAQILNSRWYMFVYSRNVNWVIGSTSRNFLSLPCHVSRRCKE